MPRLNEMAEKYKNVAHFLSVYISEAHASDVWPLGTTVCVKQHTSIQDRIDAAKEHLIEKRQCKIPILVDNIINGFDDYYHGWPERFYVIVGKNIELIGMPSNEDKGFNRDEISKWLDQYDGGKTTITTISTSY